MSNSKIYDKIHSDEQQGEKLISNIRLALGILYVISVPVVSLLRYLEGDIPFPGRSNIGPVVFFLYSVFIFIYVRKKQILHISFKYICSFLDAVLLSAAIWIGCTYPEIAPPISFLSIQALFYSILILAGSFRYSTRCAYFSGITAGISYITIVIINGNVLDLPYYFELNSKIIDVHFPIYNEVFRVIGMIVTGIITGMASKRRFTLFTSMIETETVAAETSSKTVEKTRAMAETIRKSTDEIFHSSKDIFTTANNQAASVQEIESTINENMQIAGEISEKTSSVANIASKMEDDVIGGFRLLERNINQMEDIKKKNDGVISGIIELGNKISKIRNIIRTINTITDQTKVIAFNAALEAASAGDHGKRFSVVASEVNRLADDIAALTKQIREQLEEIQSSSSTLIISSEESADKITQGNNLIKELEEIFYDIRSGAEITATQAQTITISTQKQQQSTEQINTAIANISTGLSSFLRSTEAATSSAGELTQMIDKLGNILNIKTE